MKQISVTFKVGNKKCNTVTLDDFNIHSAYEHDLISYTSTHINVDNHKLPVGISITLPIKLIESLGLSVSDLTKRRFKKKRL